MTWLYLCWGSVWHHTSTSWFACHFVFHSLKNESSHLCCVSTISMLGFVLTCLKRKSFLHRWLYWILNLSLHGLWTMIFYIWNCFSYVFDFYVLTFQISGALDGADSKDLMRKLPKFMYNEEKALEVRKFSCSYNLLESWNHAHLVCLKNWCLVEFF